MWKSKSGEHWTESTAVPKKGKFTQKAGPNLTEVLLAIDLDIESEAVIFNSSFCYQMCQVLVK